MADRRVCDEQLQAHFGVRQIELVMIMPHKDSMMNGYESRLLDLECVTRENILLVLVGLLQGLWSLQWGFYMGFG